NRQCHDPLSVAVGGISPTKGNVAVGEGKQPVVGDGDPMGIGTEIAQRMFRSVEGRLGADDPAMAEQKSEPGSEDPGCCQGREAAVELECAVAEGGFESGNELTAKEPAEHLDGKKKGAARGDPTGVVGGEAASGDYAVNVRMMMQALIPGMEHAEKADLCTKMMGIAGDLEQGLGTGVKQQAVDHALVLQGERRQVPRQGEDSMHVAGRQQFAFPRLKPVQAGVALALGTVTITTRVVRDGGMSTLGALIAMPTERGGPTACN